MRILAYTNKPKLSKMKNLEELKSTLIVRRGKRTTYYMSIEFEGEIYGMGFDDAHLWDALKDLEDTSYYENVELHVVQKLIQHHDLEV